MNILAATFTIAFEGLMMLHNPASGSAHLAIVDATLHDHTPRVFIYDRGGTLVGDEPLTLGDRVTFLNIAAGRIKIDPYFRRRVPTLSHYVVRGHVHDNVAGGMPKTGVLAYAELPAGEITTWLGFEDAVEMTQRSGQQEKRCFARFAVLGKLPATGVELKIQNGLVARYTHPIADGDIVIISNISQNASFAHFPLYDRLLSTDPVIGPIRVLYGGCDKDEKSPSVDPAVGLILTNHRPTPNGDCGPVDNP